MRAHKSLTALLADTDASIPDVLLPEQYLDRIVGQASDVPEKRLMLAVLVDAALQLRKHDGPAAAEAAHWVLADDADEPFSFQNVCEALGLDPGYLARGLIGQRLARTHETGMPLRHLRTSYRRVTSLGARAERPAARAHTRA